MSTKLTHKLMQSILSKDCWIFDDKAKSKLPKRYSTHLYIYEPPTDGSDSWNVYTHEGLLRHKVTHLEEMIQFAYNLGREDGRDEMRDDIKNLLEIKN
jgi:hypothetical protein